MKKKEMKSSVIGWHKKVNCPQIGQQEHVVTHLLAVRFADNKITTCTQINNANCQPPFSIIPLISRSILILHFFNNFLFLIFYILK